MRRSQGRADPTPWFEPVAISGPVRVDLEHPKLGAKRMDLDTPERLLAVLELDYQGRARRIVQKLRDAGWRLVGVGVMPRPAPGCCGLRG